MLRRYPRNVWLILGLCSFILLFDLTMARSQLYLDNTPLMNVGITLDYMLVIPALLYFFVFRKQNNTLAPILVCSILGYVALRLILPNIEQGMTRHLEYVLIPLEVMLVAYEGRILYRIVTHVRQSRTAHSHPIDILRNSIQSSLPNTKITSFLLHDLSILYYTLLAWKSRPFEKVGKTSFRYHKESNWFILTLMISKILLIEGVAIHLLVMQWSHPAAWLLSIGNIYMILLLIADYLAMCLNPILLGDGILRMQYGIQMRAIVEIEQIASVSLVQSVNLSKAEQQTAFTPLAVEPNVKIELKQLQTILRLFGKKQSVHQIYLFVDEPRAFQQACEDNIANLMRR
ncbi:hypothetical protein [Paenibacillus guangzhouensis]|uniref:hypothetical protein n=1 Tax=Paenibacillus guangzhouensis TaxID=1473112 RepID=UPI0012673B7C|nr:hypothetical protein [Paenibacillus guangzhouensis]